MASMRPLHAASNAIEESGAKGSPMTTDNADVTAQNNPAMPAPMRIRAILKLDRDARSSGDAGTERRRGDGWAGMGATHLMNY